MVIFDDANELALVYNTTYANIQNSSEGPQFQQVATDLPESLTYNFPVYQDQTGTVWNFLGEAIDGPFAGSKLEQLPSYNAFWFAATALYPHAEIFIGNTSATYISTHNPFDTASNPEAFEEAALPGFSLIDVFSVMLIALVGYQVYKRRFNN